MTKSTKSHQPSSPLTINISSNLVKIRRSFNPLWFKFSFTTIYPKTCFFWTPYISNVGKFFFKIWIGLLVQIWRQRQKNAFQVILGQKFKILSANSYCSYIFFQFTKKGPDPFQGYFSPDPDFMIMGGSPPHVRISVFFKISI